MRRAFISSVAAVAFVALAAGSASAHALLQSAYPGPNSVVKAEPATVRLTFTEAPDPKLSSVRVLDAKGATVASGPLEAVAGNADQLSIAMKPLPDGVYTVAWRTVSSVDGHIAAGSYAFSIGTSPPPAGGAVTPTVDSNAGSSESPGVVIARLLLYVGLLGLLGAAFMGSVLGRGLGMNLPTRLVVVELGVAFAGTVLLVAFQIADAGASVADLPGTSLEQDAILRLGPLVVAAGLLAALTRSSGLYRQVLLAATGALAALALLVEAILSHAASQPFAPAEIAIQWLHLVAVGLWLGGLAALLAQLRGPTVPAKAELARRFAIVAGIGLAAVAVTGAVRALVDIGSIDALFSTDFGRLVLLKIALLVPIAGLGALNHFRNVPRAGQGLRPLRRAGSAELGIGAALLLVASMLVNFAPPTEVAQAAAESGPSQPGPAASPPPIEVTGSDFGTSVRLRLTVSPGTVGSNAFEARLNDYDTGVPVDATAVRLTFSLPARPDIGSSSLDLRRQTAGVFVATGANLSLDGTWNVSALVAEPTTSVQIDLTVAVQSAPEQIDVNRVAGLPTIYTVHIGSGRTVQIYLDPGKPGPNLLHATWFDADGKEMTVSDAAMTELLASGAQVTLQPQILDAGHEAAPVQVDSLPATFLVTATGPAGLALRAQLQIEQSS
jgi:copper transport protein